MLLGYMSFVAYVLLHHVDDTHTWKICFMGSIEHTCVHMIIDGLRRSKTDCAINHEKNGACLNSSKTVSGWRHRQNEQASSHEQQAGYIDLGPTHQSFMCTMAKTP